MPRPFQRLAVVFLLGATSILACAPTVVSPTGSPAVVGPTAAPQTDSPPAPSPSSPSAASFTWAARPEVFAGEDGATLGSVAAGPAGMVALSTRGLDEGLPTTLLWGSPDGLTWARLTPAGLPDRVFISGLWGAAGQYWLRGQLPESDDPGILYRSSDGRSWAQSLAMTEGIQTTSVVDGCGAQTTAARDECPVLLAGLKDVDGFILRSTDGDTWAEATIDDATGWRGTQDAAPVEILGSVATSDGLLAYGNGLPNATDTGGILQARFWRSTDAGATWTRVPNLALLGDIYVRDVVAIDQLVIAVGDGVSGQAAVVLQSTDGGKTWARSSTSGSPAEGDLSEVLPGREGFIGLGLASPAQVDTFPVRQFFWTSDDGTSWSTKPAGDLEGGLVDDAVRVGDLIIAVGRAWTTEQTGTFEAPFGPAAWSLKL